MKKTYLIFAALSFLMAGTMIAQTPSEDKDLTTLQIELASAMKKHGQYASGQSRNGISQVHFEGCRATFRTEWVFEGGNDSPPIDSPIWAASRNNLPEARSANEFSFDISTIDPNGIETVSRGSRASIILKTADGRETVTWRLYDMRHPGGRVARESYLERAFFPIRQGSADDLRERWNAVISKCSAN